MKKFVFLLLCFFGCLNSPLNANEDLLKLFHLAVENGDVKLVTEVIDALLKDKNSNHNLLDALARYNERGKIDFALHNALKDRNLLSSVILVQHTKDINSRFPYSEAAWITANQSVSRPNKIPLELALEAEMTEIIPYLLMKNANPHIMVEISFIYEDEENPNYLTDLGYRFERKICVKSKKAFYPVNANGLSISRTFIGELICKNRLDIIEMLQVWKKNLIDWNSVCFTAKLHGTNFTPLQLALAIKRYEIAQFLIDHGARIE